VKIFPASNPLANSTAGRLRFFASLRMTSATYAVSRDEERVPT
jgi:hypothetical protein